MSLDSAKLMNQQLAVSFKNMLSFDCTITCTKISLLCFESLRFLCVL